MQPLSQVACEGSEAERAKEFIRHIRQMNEHMGIPEHLPHPRGRYCTDGRVGDQEANPLYPVPVIYDKKHFEEVIRKVAGK